jgi:hypothetical protein
MSFVMRKVAHCDACAHEWLLVATDHLPVHCARCKTRQWNKKPAKPARPAARPAPKKAARR